MVTQIDLGGITVDVLKKDIKNIHLSVHPPTGRVRISAPLRMNVETIRVFAISKLAWVKLQQKKIRSQEREAPKEFLDRESHYLWGRRYLLKVVEVDAPPRIELKHRTIMLYVRPGADDAKKDLLIDEWYRQQLKEAIPLLIAHWAPLIGVHVARFAVRRMKTKWGSCTPVMRSILINSELAKKPRECLEYIVVHEMAHLLEPTHNARFVSLMDQYMPKWRFYREQLNRLPVRHVDWLRGTVDKH
jgi:predicted metal-dependent hydrolase